MDLLRTRQVDPVHQSPQTRMYGFFTHGTVPPSRLYSSGFLSLSDRLRRLPSPTHSGRRWLGHAVFAALQVSGRRRRAEALASVRRSNCTDGFPVCSFHEDATLRDAREGINPTKFTSSYSPYSVASGSCVQPPFRQRLNR